MPEELFSPGLKDVSKILVVPSMEAGGFSSRAVLLEAKQRGDALLRRGRRLHRQGRAAAEQQRRASAFE